VSDIVDIFAGLLLAVAALGLLAHKLKMAYPILLVLGGLVLGLVPGLPHVRLSPELILFFFLPPLLFPAALFTSWRDFRANLRPILLLAVGLVLFTTVLVGWCVHYFTGLPLAAGFALGAIVSPPDAIAATAIVERLRVPRRIVAILEGESLVNDATALVAYQFAVAALVTGSFSLTRASGQFFVVCLGGILVGLAVGWVAAWFHRHVDDPPVETTVSLFTPFVTYLAAHRLGVSGVLAVVTAGIYLGWRTPEITTSNTRLLGGSFWNMVEFLLNGFVFILIGLALPDALHALAGHSAVQLVGYAIGLSLAVILIRILWVFPATYLPRLLFPSIRARDPCPAWQNVTIVAWTGMRGVLSLAAALALPLTIQNGTPFPGRDLILFFTFVVILATLVLQGLSLPFLIRWLGIKGDDGAEREEREARLKANQAALVRLSEIAERDPAKAEAAKRLRVEYEDRVRQLEAYEGQTTDSPHGLFSSEYEFLSHQALTVERRIIVTLRNQGVINDEVLRRIQRDIDLAEARLRYPQ
jgi:CPA1 family monovalent cation:H+ antiporter